MYRFDLEEACCDECGKGLDLLAYYNQDGLCVSCFKKWVENNE